MEIRFDAARVVKDFGGMSRTARRLTAFGHPITANAVDKWRRQNRIPINHICALAVIAASEKKRFDLLDYIEVVENDGR